MTTKRDEGKVTRVRQGANPVPAVGSHFLFIAVGLLVLLVLIVLLVAKFIRAKN